MLGLKCQFEMTDDPVDGLALAYVHEDMNVPVRDGRFLYDFKRTR